MIWLLLLLAVEKVVDLDLGSIVDDDAVGEMLHDHGSDVVDDERLGRPA